jgi:hypothetical protein
MWPPKEVENEVSIDSVQSTSDKEATYSNYKGKGFPVQLGESFRSTHDLSF